MSPCQSCLAGRDREAWHRCRPSAVAADRFGEFPQFQDRRIDRWPRRGTPVSAERRRRCPPPIRLLAVVSSFAVPGEPDNGEPKVFDVADDGHKLLQVYWLGDIAIRGQVISF